jgi:hypothetical protein
MSPFIPSQRISGQNDLLIAGNSPMLLPAAESTFSNANVGFRDDPQSPLHRFVLQEIQETADDLKDASAALIP